MKKLAAILLLVCFAGFAQPSADTLLKNGLTEVYEQPHKAIAIGEQVLKMNSITTEQQTEALLLISTGYSSQRNYFKSLDYAVRAAGMIAKNPSDDFKINAYCRLALQYQQLEVYNKAHDYLDKALGIAQNSKQKIDAPRLMGFNNAIRGMVYKQQMSCDIARNYFNKALFHYKKCEGKSDINNMSIVWYNKGNCFLGESEIDSARISYQKALDYADETKAKSLTAFAKKGLAEIRTFEGDYKGAIQLLQQAKEISKDVGDLVLNQGISKGLSENYLLTDNIRQYDTHKREYEKIRDAALQNNTRTLNQFVVRSEAETDIEVSKTISHMRWYTVGLIAIVIALIGLLLYEIKHSRKRLNNLKSRRDSLRNDKTPSTSSADFV